MKYRKKPVVIEAIQWKGTLDSLTEIAAWGGEEFFVENGKIEIETLEGTMTASVGDYIIKGLHGEFYPCKPDIFEKTYDKVESE